MVTGSIVATIRGVARGRRLFARTQRRIHKGDFAGAGAQVMAKRPRDLKGIDVLCERLGLKWRLSISDVPQRSMFAFGGFDDLLVAWVINELREGDVVVDVGAHVGLLSLQFADRLRTLGEGHVFSFEPAPDSAQRLRLHAEMNGLLDRVTVVQAAVSDENGEVALRMIEAGQDDDPSLRSIYGSGETIATAVPMVRFDDWWSENGRDRLDVLKVDVEGAELGVIRGMREALTRHQPRLLIVEIKEHLSARAGVETSEVVKELEELGYINCGPFSTVAGTRPMLHLDENFIFRRSHDA